MTRGARRIAPILAACALVGFGLGCNRRTPPATTTTTTTTATGGHDMEHGGSGGAPYISPDDPRLTPQQQRRAKDLIARTETAMKAFTDTASVVRAGYESIWDANSGFEHFFNYSYISDGHVLDPAHIESVVFETKPGQPKRLAAAMYMLDWGQTFAEAPEVAGPLTPWHNHKDLCWDPSVKHVIGVFRLGRCIPLGEVHDLPPMLHVWVVPNKCGPFAEVDDTDGIVDRYLRAQGLEPPKVDTGCVHVHGGDHSIPPASG
jgi:hypothetical protein